MEARDELDELRGIGAVLGAHEEVLRAAAHRIYATAGFPAAYGERVTQVCLALIDAFSADDPDAYASGAGMGAGTVLWLRERGERLSEVSERLHRARIELFLVEIPAHLSPTSRPAALRFIASFLTGYIGQLYSLDTARDYELAGLLVRRLGTARSLREIGRVVIEAAGRLVRADAAWLSTRRSGVWRVLVQNGLPAEMEGCEFPDSTIPEIAALLSGEIVAGASIHDRMHLVDSARSVGFHSSLTIPLLVEGECIGAVSVARRRRGEFSIQERALAEIIGVQAGARLRELHALERSRDAVAQLREHLRRAEEIVDVLQQVYIPRALPAIPGIAFDAVYQPAEDDARVGGDWYDAFALPNGTIVFSVGDVAGHGLDAAVTMGAIRQAIFAASLDSPDPRAVLATVNRVLLLQRSAIATAIVGFLDPSARTILYASAGHPPPIVADAGGARLLPHGGLPLGIQDDPFVMLHRFEADDDVLFALYTDGLIEYRRQPIEGTEALRRAVELVAREATVVDVGGRVVSAALCGKRSADDLALLVITFRKPGEGPVVSSTQTRSDAIAWDFDGAAASGSAVRRGLVAFLRHFVAPETDLTSCELIAGELIANAVLHGRPPIHVELTWRENAPVLRVSDSGQGIRLRAGLRHDVLDEHGRGLFLVAQLAADVSFTKALGGGTEVTVVLPVTRVNGAA